MFKYMYVCIVLFVVLACELDRTQLFEAPAEVRARSIKYAQKYIEEGAEYQWGGQDPLPKRIAVDCSGLVIRCYQYACGDFGYRLPFVDTTSAGLKRYAVELTLEELSPGDLLFMGDGTISHVALFVKREEGVIMFIDSTYKPEIGINGVSQRSYPETDSRFLSYGRLLVEK